MRRRVVLVVALTLAMLTAAAGVWLAIAATAGNTDAAPAASASPTTSSIPVTADDYCYVEAMIYYRVKEQQLAEALLRNSGAQHPCSPSFDRSTGPPHGRGTRSGPA